MSDHAVSVRISDWAVPDEGWLRIRVTVDPLNIRWDFYRVEEDAEQWKWRRWSAAGKPTAHVPPAAIPLLDAMVRDHPVLSRLLDQFGFEPTAEEPTS